MTTGLPNVIVRQLIIRFVLRPTAASEKFVTGNMKAAAIPAAAKELPAAALTLMFLTTIPLPAAAKPVTSAVTAMIATQAAPPMK